MSQTTAITPAEATTALRGYLEAKPVLLELQKAMPKNLSPQRLVRQTMSLVGKNPDLLKCTQVSILMGIMQAAELGLELTGPLGHAYLVPRWNGKKRCMEATFQVGWKGLVALAARSGTVGDIVARTVHANDYFEHRWGTEHWIKHQPTTANRGEPTHYYAIAFFPDGRYDFEVWSLEEVRAHRLKYSPPKEGKPDYSAWANAFDAMARKTAVRALCNRLSLCPQAQQAAQIDACNEMGLDVLPGPGTTGGRAQQLLDHLEGARDQEPVPDAEIVPPGEE